MKNYPYFIILLVVLITSILSLTREKNLKKSLTISALIFILYFSFSALRGNGNGDYFNYLNGVKYIDRFGKIFTIENYPFEIGFRVIAYINNLLKISPQFTIACLSLISLVNIKCFIEKESSNFPLSWFLYYPFLLYFDMHHSRNAIAISFICLVYHFLITKNDYKRSLIFSILAISFHKSSIFGIFILICYKIFRKSDLSSNFNPKRYLYTIFISWFFVLFINPTKLITIFHNLLPNRNLISKLSIYLQNPTWSYEFSLFDPRLWLLIIIIIIGSLFLLEAEESIMNQFEMVIIAILTILILSGSTMFVMRFYNFFNIFTIIFIPSILDLIKCSTKYSDKIKLSLQVGIISSYVLYFSVLTLQQFQYFFFF